MKKIGFIDYYLDEYHACNYPQWIKDASMGEMEVAYAWAEMDSPNGLTSKEWAAKYGITLCETIEEVIEKSDYMVVLSPDHAERHEDLCRLPLMSGKPTYVDKTFATDRAAAIRIFEHAARYNTKIYSSSALRYAPEYLGMEKNSIETISSRGPGKFSNYAIHQVEPLIAIMGSSAEKVMSIGTDKWASLLIQFSNGRQATLSHFGWEMPFSMAVNYENGSTSVITVESDFFKAFIIEMVDFFRTGIPKVDASETIQVITLIEYGTKAIENPGVWIELPRENMKRNKTASLDEQ